MKKQTMGYGDLILIAVIGAWLGPIKIMLVIFVGAFLGLSFWIIKSYTYEINKNEQLPFGAFLGISAIVLNMVEIQYINKLIKIIL